jgi:hypothetical protein
MIDHFTPALSWKGNSTPFIFQSTETHKQTGNLLRAEGMDSIQIDGIGCFRHPEANYDRDFKFVKESFTTRKYLRAGEMLSNPQKG